MAHRQQESVVAITTMVESFPGARVTFGFSKKHQSAVLEFMGRSRKMHFSMTPSCRHGGNQAAREARRVLTELGAQQCD